MTSLNVQELFEKFMQDPEYIGKEELALAEAQQRVVQHINNTKALSMAKMDSPLDNLLSFLLQKGDNDYFHHRTGHNAPSHLISTEVKEPTFEELIGHAKEELLALAPEGTTWEDLMEDPRGIFQESTNQGRLTDSNLYMTNLTSGIKGRGAVQGIEADYKDPNPDAFRRTLPKGQDALNELVGRALDNSDAPQEMEKLKGHINFFNANQNNSQIAAAKEARTEGGTGLSFDSVHRANGFVPPKATPDGEIFPPTDLSTWQQALTDVMNPDNDWHHSSYDGRWKDQKINQPKSQEELHHQGIQSKVIDLVETLTGKQYSNPKEALTVLRDIHSRPEQFMDVGDDDLPRMRRAADDGVGGKRFLPNIESTDIQEYEDNRHDSLQSIAEQIHNISENRDGFSHPPVPQRQQFDRTTFEESVVDDSDGKGWNHSQPLSPIQRWILENATHPDANISDSDARNRLQREIISRYNRTQDYDLDDQGESTPREPHSTAKGLENLFSDVVRDLNLSVPPAPQNVIDEQSEWPLEYSTNRVVTKDPTMPAGERREPAPGEVTITPIHEVLSPEKIRDKNPDQLADMLERGELSEADYSTEVNARWNMDPQSLLNWEGKKVYFNEEGQSLAYDRDNQSALSAITRIDPATGTAYTPPAQFVENPSADIDPQVSEDDQRWKQFGAGGTNLAQRKLENATNVKNLGTKGSEREGIEAVKEQARAGFGVDVLRYEGDDNFGNPFTYREATRSEQNRASRTMDTPEEATEAYGDWLRGTAHQDVRPEQREWILDQIESGDLDEANLLYYTDEHNEAGRDSHADVLAAFINERSGKKKMVYGLQEDIDPKDAVGGDPRKTEALKRGQRAMPDLPGNLYSEDSDYDPQNPYPTGHVGLEDESTHTSYGGPREPQVSQNLGHVQRGNIPFDRLNTVPHFDGEEDLQVNPDDIQNYMHHRDFIGQLLKLGVPLESISKSSKDGTRTWSMADMERGMQDHGLLQHGETIEERNFVKPGNTSSRNYGVPPIFPMGKDHLGNNPAQVRRDALWKGAPSDLSPKEREDLQKEMQTEWVALHGGSSAKSQNIEYPYAANKEQIPSGSVAGRSSIRQDEEGKPIEAPAGREYGSSKPNYVEYEGGFHNANYLKHVVNQAVEAEEKKRDFNKEYSDMEKAFVDGGGKMPIPPAKPATRGELDEYAAAKVRAIGPHPRTAYKQELLQEFENKNAGKDVDFNDIMEHFQAKGIDAPHPTSLPIGRTLPGGPGLQPSREAQPLAPTTGVKAPRPPLEELLEIVGRTGVKYGEVRDAIKEQQDGEESDSAVDNLLSAIAATIPDDVPDDATVEKSNLNQLETIVAEHAATPEPEPAEVEADPDEDADDLLSSDPEQEPPDEEPAAEAPAAPEAPPDESPAQRLQRFARVGDQYRFPGGQREWGKPPTSTAEGETPETASETPERLPLFDWAREQRDARQAGEQPAAPEAVPEEAPAAREPTSQPGRDVPLGEDVERHPDGGFVNSKTGEKVNRDGSSLGRERAPEPEPLKPLAGYTSHSGGANGADQAWDDIGQEFGVGSNHYHMGSWDVDMSAAERKAAGQTWRPFEGPGAHRHTHDVTRTPEDGKLIDEQLKSIGDELKVNTRQSWPEDNENIQNYLRRNVEQVRNADSVVAISRGIVNGKYAAGGTGWAVEYAKRHGDTGEGGEEGRDFIPIHVFDMKANKWQTWNRETERFEDTDTEDGIPELTPHFAGIGSRGDVKPEVLATPMNDRHPDWKYDTDIPQNGKDAIRAVYEKAAGQPGRRPTAPPYEIPTQEPTDAEAPSVEVQPEEEEMAADDFSDVASSMNTAATKVGLDITNKKDWSGDDIQTYADELKQIVLSRLKNGTAKNYVEGMLSHMYGRGDDERSDPFYRYDETNAKGPFSGLGLFNNGSPVGRLENFLQSYKTEHNITVGELGQWGNNNGYKWGFTAQSRWKGNGQGLSEEGEGKRFGADYSANKVSDADEEDKEDIAKLDGMTYAIWDPTHPNYRAGSQADTAKAQQQEGSIGRANRYGVPHDNDMLKEYYQKPDGTSSNDEGHTAYGDRVHSRVEQLAKHMDIGDYHSDEYDHDKDSANITPRLLALASEVSRSRVTDKEEALRILTSDREHDSTGRNHSKPIRDTDSYTDEKHDKLHNNATPPNEEEPEEEVAPTPKEPPEEPSGAAEEPPVTPPGTATAAPGEPEEEPTGEAAVEPEAPKVSREDFLDAWNDGKWRIEAYKIKAQHDKTNNLDTQMDQDEELIAAGKKDHSFTDRDGKVMSQNDLYTARMNARGLNPAMVAIRDYLNDNPDATEVPAEMAEQMFGKHGPFLPLKRGADGKMEDPQINPKLAELEEDFADHVTNPEKLIAPDGGTPPTPPKKPTAEAVVTTTPKVTPKEEPKTPTGGRFRPTLKDEDEGGLQDAVDPGAYTPTVEQAQQIGLHQDRIDQKMPELHAKNIEFLAAKEELEKVAKRLNDKEANNENVSESDKIEYKATFHKANKLHAERKTIAGHINQAQEAIEGHQKPVKEEPKPKPDEKPEEESTGNATPAQITAYLDSDEHKANEQQFGPEHLADWIKNGGELPDSYKDKATGLHPDHILHKNNWGGMIDEKHHGALETALEHLMKDPNLNHEHIDKRLQMGDAQGVIKDAIESAKKQMYKPVGEEEGAPEAQRQQQIALIRRYQEEMGLPSHEDWHYDGMTPNDLQSRVNAARKQFEDLGAAQHKEKNQELMLQAPKSLAAKLEQKREMHGDEAEITPMEATQQARALAAHHVNLRNNAALLVNSSEYQKHKKDLEELHNEAIQHGADTDRITAELNKHGMDKFGGEEHMAEAAAEDKRITDHTAEYQSLFASGSQKAVDAWNDPHYHPNAKSVQDEDGAHTGEYDFSKHTVTDKGVLGTGIGGSGVTEDSRHKQSEIIVGNRHNGGAEGGLTAHTEPPHVLGLSPEQQQEYSSLHKDFQRAGGRASGATTGHDGSDLIHREIELDKSMQESGHVKKGGMGPLDHSAFGANARDTHTDALAHPPEASPEGHHFVPGVGHVHSEKIAGIQANLKPGEGFYHTGGKEGEPGLVSHPDGTSTGKGVLVTKDGVHGVGSISGGDHTHDSLGGGRDGVITKQRIRETDLANGLHVAIGNNTGTPHTAVNSSFANGHLIGNVAKTLTESGSHFGTADSAATSIAKPSKVSQAGSALGRFAGKIKPLADLAAQEYTKQDGFKPEAVQQQTFKKVAQRGVASLIGKAPDIGGVGAALSTKITGMTPTQSATQTSESLEKLLKFVKSVK